MAAPDSTIAIAPTIDGVPLRVKLRRAERMRKVKAMSLILPLFLFLVVSFFTPIAAMLFLSVQNSEMGEVLPNTSAQLLLWDGTGFPGDDVLEAFAGDLRAAKKARLHGKIGRRLNYEVSGFRSLIIRTAEKMPPPDTPNLLEALIKIDKRWGEPRYWQAMKKAVPAYTMFYLLAALDLKIDVFGEIGPTPEGTAIYFFLLERTIWISTVVTIVCLMLGYPIAYLLATLPTKQSNLLLLLVLVPFWTSLVVRTSGWVILLKYGGLINDLGLLLGIWGERVDLMNNRISTYLVMVYIALPMMVLPLFAVMKGISPSHMRAAATLGANPLRSFLIVYVPQTIPGIGAGVLLVFIISLGNYIVPALVGGIKEQMYSSYIVYYINQSGNWGMGAALSVILIVCALVFFGLYNRLVGIDKLRMG